MRLVGRACGGPLLLPILLGLACDAPSDAKRPDSVPVPPVSGATLDAIQAEIAERVPLDAEGARIERRDEGRHLVIHVSLRTDIAEPELAAACGDIREVMAHHLEPGQDADLYFSSDGSVAYACEQKDL